MDVGSSEVNVVSSRVRHGGDAGESQITKNVGKGYFTCNDDLQ